MEWLSEASSLIILIGALVVAVTNIYKFFVNGGKGVKQKVEQAKTQQKIEEEQLIRDVIAQVQEEQADAKRQVIIETVKEVLPDLLNDHDAQRDAQLNLINSVKDDVAALAESAKDVLREKIMTIYHKNKRVRQLEEHEKEALVQYYKDYKAIKGNSYIDKYYGRMKNWNVIPDDYIDE